MQQNNKTTLLSAFHNVVKIISKRIKIFLNEQKEYESLNLVQQLID